MEPPAIPEDRPRRRTAADIAAPLSEMRSGLAELYGPNLAGVYLFGSYARGEAELDSDIDLLIVLRDFGGYHAEVERTSALRSDLSLEHEIPISTAFMRLAEWDASESVFAANVRGDAIPL